MEIVIGEVKKMINYMKINWYAFNNYTVVCYEFIFSVSIEEYSKV